MLRRTPVYLATDPAQVSSGLLPDKHPLQRPLWEAADNVVAWNGKIRRRIPGVQYFTTGSGFRVQGLSQQRAGNGARWIWAASNGIVSRWAFGAPEVIGSITAVNDETVTTPATYIDFTHYGDWTIYNSSLGAAKLHKPGIGVTDYADAPTDVAVFLKKLNFMVALGYGPRGTRVGWSDGDNIETWTATASNLAGSLQFEDFDTRIRAATRLGSVIAVYAEDQMGTLSYVGEPYYFGQKVILDGIGAVSKASVASDGKNNVGVGRNGIWWTDGNTYRYIDEGALHDYLQDNVNWDQASKIFAVRNDYTGCYEFFFPMGLNVNISEGWSFDPRTGGWSKLPAASLKDERRLFPRPLFGTLTGAIHLDASDPEVAAPLVLRTRPLLLQHRSADGFVDMHTANRVDEVELLLHAVSNVEFRIGSAQTSSEAYEWSDWIALTEANKDSTHKIGAIPEAAYWKLEFRSTANNWQLDFQGFILFGIVTGTKQG